MTLSDPRWRFVGRLCLDFAMTGGRGDLSHLERFHRPSDLRDWCSEGPLGLSSIQISDADLVQAGNLREAIQQAAFALVSGTSPTADDVDVLNTFAGRPPFFRKLDAEALDLEISTPVTTEALLSELARDMLDLVADPKSRSRVRQCASPDCGLLFFDDSRPGKRRWCSSARCGDRARARAYRARKKE